LPGREPGAHRLSAQRRAHRPRRRRGGQHRRGHVAALPNSTLKDSGR
jgi:hypothetical protein